VFRFGGFESISSRLGWGIRRIGICEMTCNVIPARIQAESGVAMIFTVINTNNDPFPFQKSMKPSGSVSGVFD